MMRRIVTLVIILLGVLYIPYHMAAAQTAFPTLAPPPLPTFGNFPTLPPPPPTSAQQQPPSQQQPPTSITPAPPQGGLGYTPSTLTCESNNIGINNSTEPAAACPSGGIDDTYPFIVPCQDKGRDDSTCTIGAFVYGEGFAHAGDVSNKVYKSPGGYAVQESNDKSLLYRANGGNIEFLQDTTWANAEYCGGPSSPHVFQRISNGGGGMLWAPRKAACVSGLGQNIYQTPGRNSAFNYDPAQELSLRDFPQSGLNACPNQIHTGDVGGARQIIFHGPARCGAYQGEMLVLYNRLGGAGGGEVFMYCKDKGLCAWYQKIDFSKPGAQPSTWTSGTDICNGFKAEYNICRTECPADGINVEYKMTTGDALKNLLFTNVFKQNIYKIVEKGTHNAAMENNDYLKTMSRTLLPGEVDYRPADSGNYDVPIPANKVGLKGNNEKISITFRSMIGTGEQIDAQNGQGVPIGQQVLTSQDRLDNTDHCKDCAPLDDDNLIGSATTGTGRVAKNTDSGINLTKPNNILDNNIIVPCNGSAGGKTVTVSYGPNGDNQFTSSGNIATDIAMQFTGSFASLLGSLLDLFGVADKVEGSLSIPASLCTCTKISNATDMQANTHRSTYAMLPSGITSKLDTIEKTAASGIVDSNQFSHPFNESDTINISMRYSHMNSNLSNLTAEKCAAAPADAQARLKLEAACNTHTPLPFKNPTDPGQPIACTVGDFQAAFGNQAEIAACVAQHESHCNNSVNKGCMKVGGTWDYSFGPFQINLLAHPASSDITPQSLFHNPDGSWKAGIPPGTWTCKQGFSTIGSVSKKAGASYPTIDIPCQIGNPAIVQACEEYFSVPQNNIDYAAALVKKYGWKVPWAGDAKACGF